MMTEPSKPKSRKPSLPSLDLEPGYKKVARVIQGQIFNGTLKAGDVLPTEQEMAELLGVNRSTVREGIRSLEHAGMVRRGAAKRLEVSVPENAVVGSSIVNALGLRRVTFFELWEMQIQLEPFAAKRAASRISQTLKEALSENVAQLRENLEDDDFVVKSDIAFHRLITEAAGNAALSLSAAPISTLLYSATLSLYAEVPQARHRLLEAHEAILDAILAGDEDRAEAWMLRHIEDFRRGYEVSGKALDAPLPLNIQRATEQLS